MSVVPVAVGTLAIGLAGCATIDRGAADKIYVLSDPPGAKATASFGVSCTTPCSLEANRRDEFTVTVEKSGYQPQGVNVATRLTAIGVGDLMEDVATAGVGMVVDATTGATLEHVPNPVSVTLKPVPGRAR